MEKCRKRNSADLLTEQGTDGCFSLHNGNFFTSSKIQASDADALLAKEMNSLSIEERERVFEDIHAISKAEDEDPEQIENALAEMAQHLEKMKKKSGFDKANFLDPAYVKNPKFRLMFLRAECFDAKKAAIRFAVHFDRKLELFGSDKLVKDIKFDDLTPDDIASLETGSIQFLPTADRSGRMIACNAQKYHNYKHWQNHIKVLWYLGMANLADNEDLQRRGLVLVVYCIGPFNLSEIDREMMTKGMECCKGIPLRYSALHYVFDDPRLRPVISFSKLIVEMDTRLRFRAHFGSHLECQYELGAYGIPREVLPFDTEGNLLLEAFNDGIQKRRERESSARDAENCRLPGKHDVLLGRGRPYQEYEGNLRLADVIDKNRSRYKSGGRGTKSVISLEIVKQVQALGGRFLKKSESGRGWVEVTDGVAADKVGHGFRTKKRRSPTTDTDE